jgi:RNA polymerase sigma-70 factor (ECF subfamily)
LQTSIAKDVKRSLLEQQFERLFTVDGAALKRLAASYTNTASDRDDLFQEIALAVWRALPDFRGDCSERTFLFRVAHNRGISYLSKRRATAVRPETENQVFDSRPGPEEELAQLQKRERLLGAVRSLPIPYRQVITLALEDLEYPEIAEILGITETNVGARLSRARQMLRTLLEKKI